MANKESEAEIEIEDDAVVTVEEAPGVGDVAASPQQNIDHSVVEVKEEPPKKRSRQQDTSEQATNALQQALESAENARKAAEATAQAERRRADEATRLANQRGEEAKTYQSQAEDRQLAIIENGIEAAKRELDSATQEQQRSYEAGEFDKATAAGARMAKAAAALDRFETSKVDYETRAKAPKVQVDNSYQSAGSQFESFVSTLAPRAQQWLRQHPECAPPQLGGDPVAYDKAMAGHHLAKSRGISEGSDEYFRTIEEVTGHRTPTSTASNITPAVTTRQQQAPQRAAMPSAPVSRDAPGPSGAPASNVVRLTPAQQEIALISFTQKTGETDDSYRKRAFSSYASELVKATKEGKIGRLTH